MAFKEIHLNPEYSKHPTHSREWWLRWLKAYKHEIHDDGSVSILGQTNRLPDEKHLRSFSGKERAARANFAIVSFNNKKIIDFPFKFRKIVGDLHISESGITSLEYGPEIVTGAFNCNGIKLKNGLKNSPKVGTFFNCANCELTSLEGSPEIVPDAFICQHNRLTSLEGGPKEVGAMNVSWNYPLESLKGAPIIKPNPNTTLGTFFDFQQCKSLKNLEYLPSLPNLKDYRYNGTKFNLEDVEEANRVSRVASSSSKKAKELFGGLF